MLESVSARFTTKNIFMRIILLLFTSTIWLFNGCKTDNGPQLAGIHDHVIQAHMSATIAVYDNEAAVKLPRAHDVGIWNPGILERRPERRICAPDLRGWLKRKEDRDGEGPQGKPMQLGKGRAEGRRIPTSLVRRK